MPIAKCVGAWEETKHFLIEGHWWCFAFLLTWLLSLLEYLLPDSWIFWKRKKHLLREQCKHDFIPSQPSDAYEEEEFTNTGVVPVEIEELEILEEISVFPESLSAKVSHRSFEIESSFPFRLPVDEQEYLNKLEAFESVDGSSVKKTGSTQQLEEKSIRKTKKHKTGKNWWYRSKGGLFIMLFPLIACDERFSRQPLFSTILCDMQMEVFKTVLPGSNIALAWTGLQMVKLLCTLRAASINSPEKMAALEVSQIKPVCLESEQPSTFNSREPVCNIFPEITETQCPVSLPDFVATKEDAIGDLTLQTLTVTVHRTNLLDERLDVSWFGQEIKPMSEFLSGGKSRTHDIPKERLSSRKNGSDNTDSDQRGDNPNEPAAEQEQDTYGESGDTDSPSNSVAGATGNDGGGDDGDGNDGDDHRRGRDYGRFEINRTNERTNQTNHNLEALENFRSPNRARHDQWSLPHGEEEGAAAAVEHEGNVDVEEQNDEAGEQPNQAINIVNNGAFEPVQVNEFSVQEQGSDTDDHHFVDTEAREDRPIRSIVQNPHDDDD